MRQKVITDNSAEKITITWDGVRSTLTKEHITNRRGVAISVIILNPREIKDLVDFFKEALKEYGEF